jgi:hypothetical protein
MTYTTEDLFFAIKLGYSYAIVHSILLAAAAAASWGSARE